MNQSRSLNSNLVQTVKPLPAPKQPHGQSFELKTRNIERLIFPGSKQSRVVHLGPHHSPNRKTCDSESAQTNTSQRFSHNNHVAIKVMGGT